ncbi:MAG: CDP-alcohol phosphatidyltransferase family protein [Candidatus Thermoplasmatota archaeon]|nr:CDP-alcohol phosphatidyltransferase family protein [Candidatus Thermoplasmatota archaeon]
MIKLLSIADIVSLTNAILGFLSIIMIFLGEIRFSFSLILLALLADGLDGIIARKTRHSELGEYMEAIGDMISLGIAPAVFVYSNYNIAVSECIYWHSLLIIVLIVFLSFNIVRLASFHIIKEKTFFVGLPASASAIIILVMAYFNIEVTYVLLVIVITSLMLISNVRFPKPTLKINVIAAVLIVLTIIVGKNFGGVAPILLLLSIITYSLAGQIYLLKRK